LSPPCPHGGRRDRIIDSLKLTLATQKHPTPTHIFEQVALIAAAQNADYF
jgi:hypothetical protein